jgi:hypothetical protein
MYTVKWIKLFSETVLAFNLHFQDIGLNLKQKQVYHSKERKILVYKQHYEFKCYLYLLMISSSEAHGNTYKPVRIYACRTYVQTERSICIKYMYIYYT